MGASGKKNLPQRISKFRFQISNLMAMNGRQAAKTSEI
jgi:hypothetical protein